MITSGLRETFIKRYIVEKTNKAELRPEEQSEKAKSCRENLWNEIRVERAIKKETQEQNKKEWTSLVNVCDRNHNIPTKRR